MRHHSSVSELKRSFMEAVPEPRPSEWDKRLSTNSPFRTASINGQLQPGVGGVSPRGMGGGGVVAGVKSYGLHGFLACFLYVDGGGGGAARLLHI